MGLGGAEEHAVGDDDGGAAAGLEHMRRMRARKSSTVFSEGPFFSSSSSLFVLLRVFVLELAPAVALLAAVEDRFFDGFDGKVCKLLKAGIALAEAADEEQEGELFDHRDRIGYSPGEEGQPDFVDLVRSLPVSVEFPGYCVS